MAASENIEFQWSLADACSEELEAHCAGVEHGRAHAIRCALGGGSSCGSGSSSGGSDGSSGSSSSSALLASKGPPPLVGDGGVCCGRPLPVLCPLLPTTLLRRTCMQVPGGGGGC